ncbi:MAG: flavodoxin family protein [Candidatus Pacearchaeota archaeon]
MKEVTILGINGSPNKNGLCTNLLKKSLKVAEKYGAKTKIIHLVDIERKFYSGSLGKKPQKDFKPIAKEVLNADGLVLATPVYWMNMSSLMKEFIDELTFLEIDNFKMEGKVAGFIATCEEDGGWQTILNMAGPLSHMGLIFPPYSMVFYNRRFPGKSEHAWMRKDFELLGKNVVELCKMIKSYEPNWDYKKKRKK